MGTTLDHDNYSPVHTRDLAAVMPQDMPPAGGYDPVQYRRNLPIKGFRPAYYLVAMGAVCTYGLWRYGQGIREQNELAREKMWSRIHLIPLLQAEEDRPGEKTSGEPGNGERASWCRDKGVQFGQIRAANICCHTEQCHQVNSSKGNRWCVYTMTALRRSERQEIHGTYANTFKVISTLLDYSYSFGSLSSDPDQPHPVRWCVIDVSPCLGARLVVRKDAQKR